MPKTTTRATSSRALTTSRNGRIARGGRLSPEPRLAQQAPEVQRYGTLRQVPIALAAEARAESATLLNEILADTTILYAMYKKHHWLVAGQTFHQLYLLFDKHAEEQLELVDEIAERVQMLGGIAVGDPRHAAELTTIPRPPDGAEPVPVMIDRLLAAAGLLTVCDLAPADAEQWYFASRPDGLTPTGQLRVRHARVAT